MRVYAKKKTNTSGVKNTKLSKFDECYLYILGADCHKPYDVKKFFNVFQKIYIYTSIPVYIMKVSLKILFCLMNQSLFFLSLLLNHLPLTTLGKNPDRGFGFFHVRKLSSYVSECWWFYSGARSCLK
jgi:hypothetical protein